MLLIQPLSVQGQTPRYEEALPVPSLELCGDQGVYVAVGTRVRSIVYRGTWNPASNSGSWNFAYWREGDVVGS